MKKKKYIKKKTEGNCEFNRISSNNKNAIIYLLYINYTHTVQPANWRYHYRKRETERGRNGEKKEQSK